MWNEPDKQRLDRIPRLNETEEVSLKEKQTYLHFYLMDSAWFVFEFDGKDICFGFVCLNGDIEMSEIGYFSLAELKPINISGWEIYCVPEAFWTIRPAKKVELICKAQGWHQKINIDKLQMHI